MGEVVSVWWGQSFSLGQRKIQKMDDGEHYTKCECT